MDILFEECVLGQKRTGKNKQFTFIQINDDLGGKNVIKGPFSREAKDRLLWISEKTQDLPFILHPDKVITIEGKYFVLFPNLLEGREIGAEKYKESFSNYSYCVLKRTSIVKLRDIIQEKWTHKFIPELTRSLVYLFLLGVGDMGMFNILADQENKEVFIIDYGDKRGKTREGPFFYFSKEPAKEKGKIWLQYAKPYYEEIAEEIKDFESEYLETALKCLSQRNIGKMQYQGPFQAKTYSGYSIDVVKSALQKYIRRNIPEKALIAAFELYRMEEVGGSAVQTNLFNRMAVIAAEDIGPANLSLVYEVIAWTLKREKNPGKLASFVLRMAESKKTRLPSHLWSAYFTPQGMKKARKYGIDLETDEGDHEDLSWDRQDPEEIRLSAEMFYHYLDQGDIRCLNWLRSYLEISGMLQNGKLGKTKLSVKTRKKRKSPIVIIWEILNSFLDVEVLEEAYYKLTENRPFLMLAVIAVLIESSEDETQEIEIDTFPYLNGKYSFEIDSYVVDVHTREGKKKGKSRKDFVEEGAVIIPEDMSLHNEILYQIYTS